MTITLDYDIAHLNNLKYLIEILFDNLKDHSGAGFRETITDFSKKVDDEIILKRMEERKVADETEEIPEFTDKIPLKIDKFREKC